MRGIWRKKKGAGCLAKGKKTPPFCQARELRVGGAGHAGPFAAARGPAFDAAPLAFHVFTALRPP